MHLVRQTAGGWMKEPNFPGPEETGSQPQWAAGSGGGGHHFSAGLF